MKNNWQTKKLGELCGFRNGLWKGKKPPFVRVGVIRNTNFTKDGKLDDTNIAFLNVELKQFEKRKLDYGDIILEKSGGGPKQPVGRVVVFDKEEGDYSFSNFTSVIRVKNSDELYFNFLHRYLHFLYISGITETMQSHSTGIRNLDFKSYKEIEIPLPSITEQKRIIKILDDVSEKTIVAKENTEKNLQNSHELFESYLQNIFANSGKDWEEKKLGEILQETEIVNPNKNPDKEFAYIDVSSVDNENFIIKDAKMLKGRNAPSRARKLVKSGDIIFATVRPTLKRIAIIPKKYDGQICSTGYFVLRAKREVDNNLIFYFLLTNEFNKKMEELQRGASYPAVTNSDVRQQIIAFPKNISEQKIIIEKLDSLSENTKKLKNSYKYRLADLDELKKSILKQAFTQSL